MGMIKRVMRPLAAVALCGVVATSLQGCIEMAIGTAVMGTLAATDRRTFGAQTEDKAIVVKGETRIPGVVGDGGHVNVSSFNRRVLLTGEVRDEAMKAAVEREVGTIDGVQSVINELEVMGASSFTSRSNDSLITGKVKASFVDSKELYANAIKVVTERGTVFLMGRVTQREGLLAGDAASNVSGVQKVVKVFDYISDDEYKRLTAVADNQTKQ
ncbi:BON domain-containing protein [Noviherbaspirillum cavernae]|uniref:BON domain-containing protein n=2 Tax=Noviherbaspirillum cavernae TaxID=2320862 RepID=A0A418WXC7_9BURK|nr:BON domain-containing protein [Noviherbaspirillum cavernae]RJG04851.1 BON domain-containing protein [Noviherbaspirillum cavernae]